MTQKDKDPYQVSDEKNWIVRFLNTKIGETLFIIFVVGPLFIAFLFLPWALLEGVNAVLSFISTNISSTLAGVVATLFLVIYLGSFFFGKFHDREFGQDNDE